MPFGLPRGADPRHCGELIARIVEEHPQLRTSSAALKVPHGVVLIHYSRAPCRKRHMLAMLRRLGLPWQPPRLQLAENLDADDLTPSFLTRCVTRQLCAPIERTQVSCHRQTHVRVALGRTYGLGDNALHRG